MVTAHRTSFESLKDEMTSISKMMDAEEHEHVEAIKRASTFKQVFNRAKKVHETINGKVAPSVAGA